MFLVKQPCRAPFALDEAACPPPGVPFDPLCFPSVFTPLYYPHLHPAVFSTPSSVCAWISTCFHYEAFGSSPATPLVFQTYFRGDVFFVNNLTSDTCLSLSVSSVSSSLFHPRPLLLKFHVMLVYSCRPHWLYSSDRFYELSLSELFVPALRACLSRLNVPYTSRAVKSELCSAIVQQFHLFRDELCPLQDRAIRALTALDNTAPISLLFCDVLTARFGPSVATCFLCPSDVSCTSSPDSPRLFAQLTVTSAPLLSSGFSPQAHSKRDLKFLLLQLHPSRRPPIPPSHVELSSTVVTCFQTRCLTLSHYRYPQLVRVLSSLLPSYVDGVHPSAFPLIMHILSLEFRGMVFHTLTGTREAALSALNNARRRASLALRKQAEISLSAAKITSVIDNWPVVPDPEVVLDCVRAYRLGSQWSAPVPCACCARARVDAVITDFPLSDCAELVSYLNLSILRITRPCHSPCFVTVPDLSSFMLDPRGFSSVDGSSVIATMHLCQDCIGPLKSNKMPRFALANNLFRGSLPDEFRDLTWIEEMVCSVYRNTAHVSRIYQSSDPLQPRVFHGNTCAHEMNVASTASVLPRTPDDVNGMLSVVFIGPGRYKKDCLYNMFHVRKNKVWRFLHWLKYDACNPLYADIVLDPIAASLLPDDGVLPGLDDRVIHDTSLDVKSTFDTETAGPDDHPALQVQQDPDSDEPVVFLEKMGVSDPECVRLQGRSFTASALRNLIREPADRPDLIIHRSSSAVPEYNNPALFPGMFPSLYPYGIGGFDDRDRPTPISFHQQANYYFDLCDFSFRYHHSFMFVALNVIQRRIAHLHTALTVSKPRFRAVASKIVALTPDTITAVAKHIENEGRLSNLTVEQLHAFDLLKEVNTIAARIPGSEASKLTARAEIRNYTGFFGLPALYFTANPNAAHSPIFQLMCGDTSVNLDECFPLLASSTKRAMRLARDPVAAADFFQFSIHCILEHLFGWNFNTGTSSEKGGILGFLNAFYASCECTERGGLHAHFLLWLLGYLNPSQLHDRLRSDPGFDKRVFAFFESIIKHDVPDVELHLEKSFEPRCERPLHAPNPLPLRQPNELDEWTTAFQSEVKKCAETLQRHTCKAVCHKYGHDNTCRFHFPHELIPISYFDGDSNSIFLVCLDSTMNYYNPHILVYCRHNHDLKWILSGKAAKAAMFYITDYITKMDTNTYQALSLLSKAVIQSTDVISDSNTTLDSARTVLHKCLSQFSKQQQIHAQQAARYIRGHLDTITSHTTVPMLSGLLLAYLKCKYASLVFTDHDDLDESAPDNFVEKIHLKIVIDDNGKLSQRNQVNDYIYRSADLSNITFFDFVQRYKVVKLPKNHALKPRSDSHHRFVLLHPHPWCETHEIIEHTNSERGMLNNLLIPRVVGSSIPRQTHDDYPMFALAHFKPFSSQRPILLPTLSFKATFDSFIFTSQSRAILDNWEAIHECEDERDADRLRKRDSQTKESQAMTNAMTALFDDETSDISLSQPVVAEKDFRVNSMLLKLVASRWFSTVSQSVATPSALLPQLTMSQLKLWKLDIKTQELLLQSNRRNSSDSANQLGVQIIETETVHSTSQLSITHNPEVSPTDGISDTSGAVETTEEMLSRIIKEDTLNAKQTLAFRIIAMSFISMMQDIAKGLKPSLPGYSAPLRLLMTGPGGTGKTHIVKSLQKVMESYGCAHNIRFLAPTGSAAALIDGMTIHKGLCIRVKCKSTGKGNRKAGDDTEDYKVFLNVTNRQVMRDEFKNVTVILIDEVSLLSLQLLSDLDHALRYVKGNNEFFGGVMMIFSGDFYQYPPVGGSPLYTPIKYSTSNGDDELFKRLGRMAWKSVSDVVSLHEQERMKEDPEYAQAVGRLRVRQCIQSDVDLFNSRCVKSFDCPNGVDMGEEGNVDATIIVPTNLVREAINLSKAKANCANSNNLIICAALDTVKGKCVPDPSRQSLLKLDVTRLTSEGSLPGFLPLYVNMPIILRNKNISTELGIANGSQGILRQITTAVCPSGLTYGKSALVEFPTSKVALPGLPPKYFPLEPIKWTFTAKLNMHPGDDSQGDVRCKVTRSQWGFQPGFACTGHAAQGKTFQNIMTGMHEGGFAAYVAASRPRTRYGLAILQPVTLADLNKRLPYDLLRESQRYEAMEHNTLVRFGLKDGSLIHVPDPEGEKLGHFKGVPDFVDMPNSKPPAKKGKESTETVVDLDLGQAGEKHPLLHDDLPTMTKKVKTDSEPVPDITKSVFANPGCQWSSVNWSCAYDSIFMGFFGMFAQQDISWRTEWALLNEYTMHLGSCFNTLLNGGASPTSAMMNYERDKWRDFLYSKDAVSFPRTGCVMVIMSEMSSLLQTRVLPNEQSISFFCEHPECIETEFNVDLQAMSLCSTPVWSLNASAVGLPQVCLAATAQEWYSILMQETSRLFCHHSSHWRHCVQHGHNPTAGLKRERFPTTVVFEVYATVKPLFTPLIRISTTNRAGTLQSYRLCAVLYSGGGHFTASLVDGTSVWSYDGAQNDGRPVHMGFISKMDITCLRTLEGRDAHIYIYMREN